MIESKHPDVKPGDQIRLPDGEIVTIVSRRSVDTIRMRYPDSIREESITEWEPV